MEQVATRIDDQLAKRWNRLPWGVRSMVLRSLIKFFCDYYDRHGDLALGVVASGDFHLTSEKLDGQLKLPLDRP